MSATTSFLFGLRTAEPLMGGQVEFVSGVEQGERLRESADVERFDDAMRVAASTAELGALGSVDLVGGGGGAVASAAQRQVSTQYEVAALQAETAMQPGAAPQNSPKVTGSIDSRGNAILDGLTYLRGVFDQQLARVEGLAGPEIISSHELVAAQVEIAKFSLLVDVTSKLVGKSTQAFDTLMKGQ